MVGKKLSWASGLRILVAAPLLAGPVRAQCEFEEDQRLVPGNSSAVAYFGSSAASWGDEVLIGAQNQDFWVGGASLWENAGGTWVETAALEASDGVRNDLFGASVALDADRIVVGATQFSGAATETGKVYVFDRAGGLSSEDHILTPSLGMDFDRFGHAVAIHGDTLVVSAIGDDTGASSAGAVYVFEFDGTNWIETQILYSPSPSSNARYGEGLAFDGTTLMVGCPGDGTNLSGAGAVYVYQDLGGVWSLDQTVFGTSLNLQLGAPLAMSGDRALAGLLVDGVVAMERVGGSWGITQTLLASDNVIGDDFGQSLAIDGTLAAVGAPFADVDGLNNAGASYAFRHDGVQWLEVGKGVSQLPQAVSYLGSAVAISGEQVIAGAEREDAPDIDSGAAFAYSIPALGFDLQPNSVPIGGPVSFLACGGSASSRLMVFVTAIDGAPFSRRLFRGRFDAVGAFRLDTTVPGDPALAGIDLSLITFALMADSSIAQSNPEVLAIQ